MNPKSTTQELRWRIAQLEAELREAHRLREQIEESTIWKATYPLRMALAPLSALRRKIAGSVRGHRTPSTPALAASGSDTLMIEAGGPVVAARRAAPLHEGYDFLFVTFEWETTARPSELGLSADSRQLAAGFTTLAVYGELDDENQHPRESDGAARQLAKIDFRLKGNAARHVCFGYSYIEDWGTWTSGGRSSVLLWVPAGSRNCELRVAAQPFSEAFSRVKARVLVNDTEIGHLTVGEEPVASLRFDLDRVRHSLSASSKRNVSLDAAAKPAVSIIILNFNKPGMTLAAVMAALSARTETDFEIIVVDNGSEAASAAELADLEMPVRLLGLGANRFFGEGNNIGAESARAPVLMFLNNDAFLADHAIDRLLAALAASPDVGATGPVIRYPDRTLQEAGAFLNPDGTAYQRGKGVPDFDLQALPPLDPVDYISAAALMIRAEDFERLGGFDLRYDPAYYEDSDLCLRLKALGKSVLLVRDAEVIHVENATTADPANAAIATNIVERHRQIFLSRWGDWLARRESAALPPVAVFDPVQVKRTRTQGASADVINAVYTPFPLVSGGGERYILGTALALRAQLATAVVTPDEYSTSRLNTLMYDLGYPPETLFTATERDTAERAINRFVLMGNEVLPTRAGYGRHRIYHCQFPFPTPQSASLHREGLANLDCFETIVVNSAFTLNAYQRELAALDPRPRDVRVIHPPVRLLKPGPGGVPDKEKLIVSIGRFTPHGHAKRQDVIMNAMAMLAGEPRMKGWRLVLCGMVPNEPAAIALYKDLLKKADACQTEIVLAPSREQIEDYLWRARVYVSAAGAGVRTPEDHWRCEHFGITVVEAASAGCIPVGYRLGGPAEIISRLGVGGTFSSTKDLARRILEATEQSESPEAVARAVAGCEAYSEAAFMKAWMHLS